jgi:hypothetical protein
LDGIKRKEKENPNVKLSSFGRSGESVFVFYFTHTEQGSLEGNDFDSIPEVPN